MRVRTGAVFALVLFALAAPAAAQQPAEEYAGRRVAEVRLFEEREPVDDAVLRELVETRAGEPLSLEAVRESIGHLFSLGRYQDVQVEAVEAPGGAVALHYNLVPIRAVERVDFSGRLGLSERRLRRALEERFGRTPQLGRAAEAARLLERLYQDHGYSRASVRPAAIELEDPDRTVLTFTVDAGPQARVGSVEVTAGAGASDAEVLRALDVARGAPYERAALQARLASYAQALRRRGYLQATASHTARISDDGREAHLALDVQRGPLVRVTFAGDPLPRSEREALVQFQREGAVDEDLVEDAVQRIREHLRAQGYWKADVSVERIAGDGVLTLAFTVNRGALYRVAPAGIDVVGNEAVTDAAVQALVPLAPGDPYVARHLDAAAGALMREYRSRGYAWADIGTSEIEMSEGNGNGALVRPVILVNEGPRAVIGEIRITGVQALTEAEILRVVRLQPGAPYYEPLIRADRDAVELEYRDLGYASVKVDVTPKASEDRARVDLTYHVSEGPQTLVDHVIVVGNRRTAEEVIRREILLRPGEPLGLDDVLESRRRLSALGLFRRVDIRELEHGPADRRDVLVTVEEAPATTLGYGGGVELTRRLYASGPGGEAEERIELAPRGFFEIGRRNLGGKNRSVNLFTRVSVRPQDAPEDPDRDGRGFGFSDYRVIGTYREPRAFDRNADFTLTGAVEQGVRTSFNFARKGVTAELLRRFTPAVRGSFRYSFGTTRTFDERLSEQEQAAIDRLFPQVRLSAFSGAVVRDTRDDVVEPSRGGFLSAESSVAARALGGQVGFMKTYLQGLYFRRLPRVAGAVFAARASVGLADGFPRAAGDDPAAPAVEDLPASERFFAGGDNTIRGFALDTVGAPGTLSPRGFPRGGNGVLILNGELRVPVWRDLGAAVFVDGGNVFERVTDFDAGQLRGSYGFGVRYRSPIGPVRLDLGIKMDRREYAGRTEPRSVLHFSIGQAF